jgi:hypothetical protein
MTSIGIVDSADAEPPVLYNIVYTDIYIVYTVNDRQCTDKATAHHGK